MLYIHVPFCLSRCIYCDFYSTVDNEGLRAGYVRSLQAELRSRCAELPGRKLRSIYFGGGTPSLLGAEELEAVFRTIRECFRVLPSTEVTLEANPDDVCRERIALWRGLGVNRVSLGTQSFSDGVLRTIGRRHTAEQAVRAVHALVGGGIANVSIDLIYGLPGQTFEVWQSDLRRACALPVTHLSAYSLTCEAHSPLGRLVEAGSISLPPEELSLRMFGELLERTEAAGLRQYEISNFCRAGFHSRHNSGYWRQLPYLGCGPGAHSFDGRRRRFNLPDLPRYAALPGRPPHEVELLTETERCNEFVFTALRTVRGFCVDELRHVFGEAAAEYVLRAARPHLERGMLELCDGRLRISRRGWFVSDDIMSDLMQV